MHRQQMPDTLLLASATSSPHLRVSGTAVGWRAHLTPKWRTASAEGVQEPSARRRAHPAPRIHATAERSIYQHGHAAYQHVLKSHGRQGRLLVRRLVDDRRRVEHGDVGIGTDLEATLVPERRR